MHNILLLCFLVYSVSYSNFEYITTLQYRVKKLCMIKESVTVHTPTPPVNMQVNTPQQATGY